MSVSVADLAVDLRLLATPPAAGESQDNPPGLAAAQVAVLTRVLATAQTLVAERTPTAPALLCDQAILNLAGYLFDRPSASPGTRFANAWGNSGASELLAAYVRRRARIVGGAAAAAATGTPGGGVLDVDAINLLIQQWFTDNFQAGGLPMPATPAEAANGTSTTIRSWTSELIRTNVNAVAGLTWTAIATVVQSADDITLQLHADAPAGFVLAAGDHQVVAPAPAPRGFVWWGSEHARGVSVIDRQLMQLQDRDNSYLDLGETVLAYCTTTFAELEFGQAFDAAGETITLYYVTAGAS